MTNAAHDFTGENERRAEQDRRRQHYSDQARIAALEAALLSIVEQVGPLLESNGYGFVGAIEKARKLLDDHTP